MQTKEITVSVKKSRNFQTYEVGMSGTLEEGDDELQLIREMQAKCRKLVAEQFAIDTAGGAKA